MSSAASSSGAGPADDGGPRVARVLDPLETVRQHPEWYFRGGRFDTEEAVGLLVAEAMRGGARAVAARRADDWVTVSADSDWLAGDLAAFVSPQQDPAAGTNSSRIEVALVAFCRAVVTRSPEGGPHWWPSAEAVPLPTIFNERELATAGRAVAFLPPKR